MSSNYAVLSLTLPWSEACAVANGTLLLVRERGRSVFIDQETGVVVRVILHAMQTGKAGSQN